MSGNIFAAMNTFYGYKKCSTCRKAEKALEKAGCDYTFVDITLQPPSKAELKRIQTQSGLPLRKLFNTSGELYKLLRIKDKVGTMSDEQIFDMLSQNGRLIKRPLVTDGKHSTVGFDDAVFRAAWM
jgi:arsenate reductase